MATLGDNASWHVNLTGHAAPVLVDFPVAKPVRVKRPIHPDTQRLKTLIEIYENGSGDFEQELYFARQRTKTVIAAFRRALDRYRESHE